MAFPFSFSSRVLEIKCKYFGSVKEGLYGGSICRYSRETEENKTKKVLMRDCYPSAQLNLGADGAQGDSSSSCLKGGKKKAEMGTSVGDTFLTSI